MKNSQDQLNKLDKTLNTFIVETRGYQKRQEEKQDYFSEEQGKILAQGILHNGRMKAIELWQARVAGGKAVVKGVWGVFGVFLIAGIFALFQMYTAIQELPLAIAQEVENQLSNLIIEVIE